MTCDERRVVAFVSGQLSEVDEQAFDDHLLTCGACWQAVHEDRLGRLAVERLRVSASPGLTDRVALAIRLTKEPPEQRGRRADRRHIGRRHAREASHKTRRLAAAAVLAVAAFGAVLGWKLQDRPGVDPPQIARVAAMMSPGVADDAALRGGKQFDVGGQFLTVRSYKVGGEVVLVATSSRPFPIPASVHLLAGSSPEAWMATRGKLAMYGVNQPSGRASMFLVAAMPMAKLPQVAAGLHLI